MRPRPPPAALASRWPIAFAALVWLAGWLAMTVFDGRVDLANLAMVLVLASALATLWLPIGPSLLVTAASVLAFNWLFVPPRHTFTVDVRQDALLLGAMLAVSWIVAGVVARQRRLADVAARHAQDAEQLRSLGEALRDADNAEQGAAALRASLADLLGASPTLLVLRGPLPAHDEAGAVLLLGEPTADQLSGLWQCLRQRQPFGPGTGRHDDRPEWYLPLRGRHAALGAARVALPPGAADDALRVQAQALCDQAAQSLQRAQSQRATQLANEAAQAQVVRSTFLAAISHDYRTPLAAIMGAASSLRDQGEQLATTQRTRLAERIVEETAQLGRLTDNTLQLVRLDHPGVALQLDWESAEEIVGAVLRRTRLHDPGRRVRARLEPDLPLVRADARLLAQLLENLVDNALAYSPAGEPIELIVERRDGNVVLAVCDRGPGVAPEWRERIFEVFQRGDAKAGDAATAGRRGAGVGLAVCRAIARAHGGELTLCPRAHGGSRFECRLPEHAPPPPAVDASSREAGR